MSPFLKGRVAPNRPFSCECHRVNAKYVLDIIDLGGHTMLQCMESSFRNSDDIGKGADRRTPCQRRDIHLKLTLPLSKPSSGDEYSY